MPEETDKEWAERMVAKMRATGHRHWLVGVGTCMACDHSVIMICPYPIGLEPNAECSACHKHLVVFDNADELKQELAQKGLWPPHAH